MKELILGIVCGILVGLYAGYFIGTYAFHRVLQKKIADNGGELTLVP
jgi:uncharacterized protein YneF (UPF0154 family)